MEILDTIITQLNVIEDAIAKERDERESIESLMDDDSDKLLDENQTQEWEHDQMLIQEND